MKTVSVKLPQTIDKKVQREAKKRGISKAALVQAALEAYLRPAERGRKTVGELIGHLAGSVAGPGDLSCNPKYLEGLGK